MESTANGIGARCECDYAAKARKMTAIIIGVIAPRCMYAMGASRLNVNAISTGRFDLNAIIQSRIHIEAIGTGITDSKPVIAGRINIDSVIIVPCAGGDPQPVGVSAYEAASFGAKAGGFSANTVVAGKMAAITGTGTACGGADAIQAGRCHFDASAADDTNVNSIVFRRIDIESIPSRREYSESISAYRAHGDAVRTGRFDPHAVVA
jgi:hypothetical protein